MQRSLAMLAKSSLGGGGAKLKARSSLTPTKYQMTGEGCAHIVDTASAQAFLDRGERYSSLNISDREMIYYGSNSAFPADWPTARLKKQRDVWAKVWTRIHELNDGGKGPLKSLAISSNVIVRLLGRWAHVKDPREPVVLEPIPRSGRKIAPTLKLDHLAFSGGNLFTEYLLDHIAVRKSWSWYQCRHAHAPYLLDHALDQEDPIAVNVYVGPMGHHGPQWEIAMNMVRVVLHRELTQTQGRPPLFPSIKLFLATDEDEDAVHYLLGAAGQRRELIELRRWKGDGQFDAEERIWKCDLAHGGHDLDARCSSRMLSSTPHSPYELPLEERCKAWCSCSPDNWLIDVFGGSGDLCDRVKMAAVTLDERGLEVDSDVAWYEEEDIREKMVNLSWQAR